MTRSGLDQSLTTTAANLLKIVANKNPDQVPVEGLIDAVNAVLRRDAGIGCGADDILIVSGSPQALDLVNATLLARGDTVIIEIATPIWFGTASGLRRFIP